MPAHSISTIVPQHPIFAFNADFRGCFGWTIPGSGETLALDNDWDGHLSISQDGDAYTVTMPNGWSEVIGWQISNTAAIATTVVFDADAGTVVITFASTPSEDVKVSVGLDLKFR